MTAPRRSKRSKTTVKNYYNTQGDVEEDDNLTPVRSIKRRRRVIVDSDDESEHNGDESVQPRSVRTAARLPERASYTNEVAAGTNDRAHCQASELRDSPLPTPPDAIVAEGAAEVDVDELDAYFADGFDNDDVDDEDDEEYIPGPDVEDEDDLDDGTLLSDGDVQPPTHHQPQEPEADVVNERFAQILRKCLEELIGWAKEQDYKTWEALPRDQKAMTTGARRILVRVDIDLLMNMYLTAYSSQVQNFVASPTWTLEAILALPDTFGDRRQGIYGNFPTGGPSRPQIGCEAYIGSAKVLHERTLGGSGSHSGIARKYSTDTLPPRHLRSLHYNDICRPGVTNNFRALCGFGHPVEFGYLHLLESVNMTIFGSYNDPGYYHKWASKASYDLSYRVRSCLGLPDVPWKGLNAAWPLFQGLPVASRSKILPCANESCGNTTYPSFKRPEGSPKVRRVLYNPGNPLGEYICTPCGHYRWQYGTLPNEAWCREMTIRAQRRHQKAELVAQNGGTTFCYECGDDEAVATRAFSVRDGKVYCHTCLSRNRRGQEARNMISMDESCYDCGTHRSDLAVQKVKIKTGVKEYPGALTRNDLFPGHVFCLRCHKFIKRNGVLRNTRM
ncbi:unnamed protein product [Alternaria alternata]